MLAYLELDSILKWQPRTGAGGAVVLLCALNAIVSTWCFHRVLLE